VEGVLVEDARGEVGEEGKMGKEALVIVGEVGGKGDVGEEGVGERKVRMGRM
jgi:hypothetical protein